MSKSYVIDIKKYNNRIKNFSEIEKSVLLYKGTEPPFSGKFWKFNEQGVYTCKVCGSVLFHSEHKFSSSCGWLAFDGCVPNAVTECVDSDGLRTEVICSVCSAHLGHVFRGEGATVKNVRYCINSVCLDFIPKDASAAHTSKMQNEPQKEAQNMNFEEAVFAGGCFWCLEDFFSQQAGVLSVTSGYTGGTVVNPTYNDVCTGRTGHAEAIKISFDSAQISYEALARLFFCAHDPTQLDRQGPDIGNQYRSAIFYANEAQRAVAHDLMGKLVANGYDIETELVKLDVFYEAEEYHQRYYQKNGKRHSITLVDRFTTKKTTGFYG